MNCEASNRRARFSCARSPRYGCDALLDLGPVAHGRASDASVVDGAVDTSDGARDAAVDLRDPVSCRDILARSRAQGATVASGLYVIDDGQRPVYCDMTTDGGGWTALYAGVNGSPTEWFEKETESCPLPASSCLHHAPATLDATTEFMVTCGDAALAFRPGPKGLDFFQRGLQSTWIDLLDVRAVAGDAHAEFARQLWTGEYDNRGFIFSAREDPDAQAVSEKTFASGYDFNQRWNYCNGVPSTTDVVRISYR